MGKYDALFEEEKPRGKYQGLFDEQPEQPLERPEQQSGILSKIVKDLSQRASNVNTAIADKNLTLPSRVVRPITETGGAIGDLISNISSVINPKQIKDIAEKGVQKYTEATNKIPGVQELNKVFLKIAEKNPEAAKTLSGLPDILNFMAVPPVLQAGTTGAKIAVKTGSSGAKMASKGIDKLEKGAGSLFSTTTRVSKEALEEGSSKAGRVGMKESVGKEFDISERLVRDLKGEGFDNKVLASNETISEALSKMPNVDISNTINALQRSKVNRRILTPWDEKANSAIDEIIGNIGNAVKKGGPMISPREFVSFRMRLDKKIPWDDETKNIVERALVNARETMRNDLINAAQQSGNSSYVSAMEDLSRKLQARDSVLDDMRGNPEAFIGNLFSKNKTSVQNALKEFDGVMGTKYAQEAKSAHLAKQYGESGTPGLLTRGETGKYGTLPLIGGAGYAAGSGNIPLALGSLGAIGIGSPMVATRTLGTMKGAKKGLNLTSKYLEKASEKVPEYTIKNLIDALKNY